MFARYGTNPDMLSNLIDKCSYFSVSGWNEGVLRGGKKALQEIRSVSVLGLLVRALDKI